MKKVVVFVLSLCITLSFMPITNIFAANEQPAMYLFKDVLRASFNHAYKVDYPYRKPVDIISDAGAKANAYAPFDCKVVKIEENQANMVGLVSLNPVRFANGEINYMTIMVAHDNDISDIYVGKTYKQGDVFYQQGDVEPANGNHIHLEAARGAFKGGSIWQYVRSAANAVQPNEAFYLYDETKIVTTGGRTWNRISGGSSFSGGTVTTTTNKPGRTSQPTVSVNNNNASVTVNWNSVANATSYDVYLVQEPWGWGDIKYRGSTQGTSYTFTKIRNGKYAAFVIARPNKDTVQSEWRHDVIVKKATQVTPGRTSQPAVSVNNNNASVTVNWNSVANATSYDVYLVQEPWGWGDIKYRGSTQGTSYTFTNVRDGKYAAFVIARPNKDSVQSEWSSFNVNAAPTSTVDFSNIKASNISETNAKLSASVSYSGKHPSEVGIYLGDSTGSMRKVSSDKINHSKNPFDMWYDLNKHGVTLSAGTQYYYKMYAIVDGKEFTSKTKNFWTSLTISVNSGSEKKNPDPVGMPAVSVDGSTVSVSWNSVANATSYDVYLVQEPWGWGDIKYRGSTQGTSYTFTNVRNGAYAAFVIARPNKDTVQSEWSSFNVNAASTSTADFYNINASNVSQTNAQLNASISYSGNHPSEVGVYFGNSADSMRKVGSDAINHNKNPFDMWYSLNKYGVTLSAGTTYYYKMYAIMDGREVTSSVQSFTTPAQVNSNLVTARVSGTPGGLAINSQPNQYTKIGRMDEGVYCTIDLSRTSGNWYYVTYNGVSGYAYNRYLVIQ